MKSRILDQFGNPIDMGMLQETQSERAEVVHLHREQQEHPARGMTPAKLANILEQIEAGDLQALAWLGQDIERRSGGHLLSLLSIRKRSAQELEWDIQAPRGASAYEKGFAGELRDILEDIQVQSYRQNAPENRYNTTGIEDLIFEMGDALLPSYSCIEMSWHYDGAWMPRLEHRDPAWFTVPQSRRNLLMLRSTQTTMVGDYVVNGEYLQEWSWITHVHKSMSGYLTNSGLTFVLSWPYVYMAYGIRDFSELLEIAGAPFILARYPSGATPKEKGTLRRAMQELGHSGRIMLPQGMDLEVEQAANFTGDHHLNMVRWAEGSQSKAVLGGTLNNDAEGGTKTNALGTVHKQTEKSLVRSDAKQYSPTITRDLVYPMSVFHSKRPVDPRRPYRFVFKIQQYEELETFGNGLKAMKEAGFGKRIGVSWIHRKSGIPEPEAGELTLGDLEGSPPPPSDDKEAESKTALKAGPDGRDEIDLLAYDMAAEWRPVMEPAVNPIVALARQVNNYDDFEAGLSDAVEQMDMSAFANFLYQGLATARTYGQATPPDADEE